MRIEIPHLFLDPDVSILEPILSFWLKNTSSSRISYDISFPGDGNSLEEWSYLYWDKGVWRTLEHKFDGPTNISGESTFSWYLFNENVGSAGFLRAIDTYLKQHLATQKPIHTLALLSNNPS